MTKNKFILSPHLLKKIIIFLFVSLGYYVMAEVCRNLASTPQSVTPVWLPDGLAVGAILIWGNWLWFSVFLGSFLANIFAFKDDSSFINLLISFLPVFLIALGTTFGTLGGAYLLKKFVKEDYPLDRIINVLKFFVLVGLITPIINATVGVTSLTLSGKIDWSIYITVWLTWWVSNVSGILIIAPILLSWHYFITNYNFSQINLSNLQLNKVNFLNFILKTEPLLLPILTTLIAYLIFESTYHLEYIIIPLLIWNAFRLGQSGGTLAVFLVAGIASMSTVNGRGGFFLADLNKSLILLESFIAVITLTILVLTGAILERKEVQSQLKLAFAEIAKTNETLEQRVKERTEELKDKNLILEETLQSLKNTQLQMIQTEKMSALGQLVGGVAHEINNPVNFIHGNLNHLAESSQDLIEIIELYQEEYPQPSQFLQEEIENIDLPFLQQDLEKIIKSMQNGTKRIKEIVLSLRNFSRLDESELKEVDLHEGIDNTLVILQHRLHQEEQIPEINVIKEYGKLPIIKCFAGQLNQVFMNILNNAIDSIKEYNKKLSSQELESHVNQIKIETKIIDNQEIIISISDNGMGINSEDMNKVFDPFFTTKPVGKGTGLGLSISYQIITEKHQGKLWVDSNINQGAKFVIELPINLLN